MERRDGCLRRRELLAQVLVLQRGLLGLGRRRRKARFGRRRAQELLELRLRGRRRIEEALDEGLRGRLRRRREQLLAQELALDVVVEARRAFDGYQQLERPPRFIDA